MAMAMAIRLIKIMLLLLLCLFLSIPVHSLYEDQVGLMDWHQQYIGKVKQAIFHTQKAGRKRVVVSTEENVVASLDLRRGEIFWRHVLGENDVIDAINVALGKYVITLSSEGSIIRAWNLPDGQMVWESFLSGSNPSKSLLLISKIDKDDTIFVYGHGCLYAISSLEGEVLWKKDLAIEGIEVQQLIHPLGSDVLYGVGISGSSQLDTCQISVKNGEVLKHESAALPDGFSGELFSVSTDKVVGTDASRSIVYTASIAKGGVSVEKTRISDLLPDFSGGAVLLPCKSKELFALKTNDLMAFIKVADNSSLELVDIVDDGVTISDAIEYTEGHESVALVKHEGSKIELTIHGSEWENDIFVERIEVDPQRGNVHKIFINSYTSTRAYRSFGFRALLVMEDHSLLLVQQGAIVWYREDGLASIIDVVTSELPIEKQGVSVAKVEQSLFEWLKGHMLKLKGTLMLANPDEVAQIQSIRMKSSEKSKMTRDHNGFRKQLIVLTRAGKLFSLHTGDGRVIWSVLLQSLRKSEGCQCPIGLRLYQWQVPHHHALDENPTVLVVGRCGHSLDSPGVLSVVDTYTGNELNPLGAVHSIVQVIPLPFTDSTEQRLHLLIDSDLHAHLYPKTPEALSIFRREFGNVYWYSVETDKGIIRGHVLNGKCALEKADDFCFNSGDLWSVVFPLESEKIIATVTRKSNEVVHTQAKIAAEQDLMYKFISKNLLFVATVAPKAAGKIGSATPDESSMVVYLIDTVTGRILHRVTHHGSQGPVRAVFSENWVVYHYFNLKAHRYEMSVIEIYDQSRADNKDILKLIVGKHNLTSPMSSYSRPDIVTKTQSYFFTHSVKTIAVTSTAKGITSKQLLIGTIGDQVLALDKRFVDPRRTVNPSPAEKEEGVIPLTDTIPIMPQSYVTHSLKVGGLRGIISVPAKLESTTLIFSYGVDLFFTRMAPSRTYDSLTEDFSYALLLITIVALCVAIFVTWGLSQRKELEEKWR